SGLVSTRLVPMAQDLLERCSRRQPEPGIPSLREGRIQSEWPGVAAVNSDEALAYGACLVLSWLSGPFLRVKGVAGTAYGKRGVG
ncbi:hypothetical protein, partial [Streptomyces sp. NPDC048341]|uniref:hypothetical protein n=1 Tax=Streptomyces sp. NPDC048341 TaxID=3154620 RepID=UPI0034307D5B